MASDADRALPLGSVESLGIHAVLIAKDGREIPVESSGASIREADGAVHGGVLVSRDCSAEQKTQDTLREALELRQLALDAAEMGTWTFDLETQICTADDRCQAIVDIPGDCFTYDRLLDKLHPEDRQRVDQANRAAFDPASDGRYDSEYRVIWADGSVHWVAAKGLVTFEGESRRAVRSVGTVLDITARKEAEESRRTSE